MLTEVDSDEPKMAINWRAEAEDASKKLEADEEKRTGVRGRGTDCLCSPSGGVAIAFVVSTVFFLNLRRREQVSVITLVLLKAAGFSNTYLPSTGKGLHDEFEGSEQIDTFLFQKHRKHIPPSSENGHRSSRLHAVNGQLPEMAKEPIPCPSTESTKKSRAS
ncbi:hypothetical protein VTI74DRAFT_10042 [Chaetomium olivicolor]